MGPIVKIGIIILIITICPLLYAHQSGAFKGIVVDIYTGKPLNEVSVRIQKTSLVTRTNAKGEFIIDHIPVGNYKLEFIAAGYKRVVLPQQIRDAATTPEIRVELAPGSSDEEIVFTIGPIQITADQELLPEKLETMTLINSGEIEHIQAISLGDVLDLAPGVEMKNQPALKDVTLAMIRDPRANNALTSFGAKIIVDDIPISNNANLQGVLLKGVYTGTGNGVDLREFPADNIQSVQVIRGIAPAQYGDFSGSIISVKTRSSPGTTHRIKGKNNPDTRELNLYGNLSHPGNTELTYYINWAYSEEDIRKDYDNTQRLVCQMHLKNKLLNNKLTINNQCNYSTLFENVNLNPEDPDSLVSVNKSYRLIFGNRWEYQFNPGHFLTSNFYVNYHHLDSYKQARKTAQARTVSTCRDEGTMIGIKQYGPYVYHYRIDGDELSMGHEIEWSRAFFAGSFFHDLTLGHQLQYDDNFGTGRSFDLLYPASPGDRPRPFDEVPGTLQHCLYFNHQITGRLWHEFALNWGIRWERYTTGTIGRLNFFQSQNGLFLNPRVNLAYHLDQNTQLRLGYGRSSKIPPLSAIYPDPEYLDVLDIVPVYRPGDTLFILDSLITTYIFDRSNPKLKGFREKKFELSLDRQIYNVGISLTGFYSRRTGEPIPEPKPYLYYRYYRPYWPDKMGESVADTLMSVYQTQVNGGWSKFDGLELTCKTRRFQSLNLDFMITAAYHRVKSSAQGLSWGNITPRFFIPLYKPPHSWTQKIVLTYQVNYISKSLGLWMSITAQEVPFYRTKSLSYPDPLAVAYYDGLSNKIIPIPESERMNPQYHTWRLLHESSEDNVISYPDKWIINFRVSKSLFRGAEVSFYVNNLLDDRAYYQSPKIPNYFIQRNPEIFYGIEFSFVILQHVNHRRIGG